LYRVEHLQEKLGLQRHGQLADLVEKRRL